MRRAFALAAAVAALGALPARAAECALALALALDISSSVDAAEYEIQKTGLALALRDAEVRAALLEEPGSIRLMVYEWSGWAQQDAVADWSVIRDPSDIDALAATVERSRRLYSDFSTAIGRALIWGAAQFARLDRPCRRSVIDISGDGVNNDGVSAAEARGAGALRGLTVNGLVIAGADPDPEAHYRDEVVGGDGAFLVVARNGFEDYARLMAAKLLRELKPPVLVGALAAPPAP